MTGIKLWPTDSNYIYVLFLSTFEVKTSMSFLLEFLNIWGTLSDHTHIVSIVQGSSLVHQRFIVHWGRAFNFQSTLHRKKILQLHSWERYQQRNSTANVKQRLSRQIIIRRKPAAKKKCLAAKELVELLIKIYEKLTVINQYIWPY